MSKRKITIEVDEELAEILANLGFINSDSPDYDSYKSFLRSIQHEMLLPVAPVKSIAQLIMRDGKDRLFSEPESVERLVQTIFQNAEIMINHINRFFFLAVELSENSFWSKDHNLSVDELATITNNVFQELQRAEPDKSHILNNQLNEGDKRANISNLAFMRLIAELLSNATKFSDENSTIIIYGISTSDTLHIKIVDQGMGIADPTDENLFRPFVPYSNLGGYGYGLAIAKRIVEYHSGKIWIESEVGRGTTVHFTLPLAQ